MTTTMMPAVLDSAASHQSPESFLITIGTSIILGLITAKWMGL